MQVQVLFPAPLAPVKGAVSELIRNDKLAFLYAKTAPMPPLPLHSERIHGWACVMGPGSFGNASGQPCRNGGFCRFPRGYTAHRVCGVLSVCGQHCHVPVNHKSRLRLSDMLELSASQLVIVQTSICFPHLAGAVVQRPHSLLNFWICQ